MIGPDAAVIDYVGLWHVSDKYGDDACKLAENKALANRPLDVKPTELPHIKNCKTARRTWDTLHVAYKTKGPVKLFKIRLLRIN